MEEKKHIDRLYQEKFKDFEATPREAVWKNLSARLHEKQKKKKVVPLWYKLAGIAAVLALLVNFANSLFNTGSSSTQIATEADDNFGQLNLASEEYNRNMIRSSIILQALVKDTENKRALESIPFNEERTLNDQASVNYSRFNSVAIATDISLGNYSFNDLQKTEGIALTGEKPTKVIKLDLPIPLDNDTQEDLIAENSSEFKKLRVSPTAAPIYFDNFGNSNTIDSRFNNNESGGEITMSYGINFAYQISEKIKLRSGVNKVDMSYNTKNIAFTAAVNPNILSGIDYNGNIPNYRIEDRSVRRFSNISASSEFDRASLASPAAGFLNQKFGFIEVPLEIEYALIDKKVGLNLIGGGSTLFMDENMVSLNSSNFSTNLGRSSNVNKVSFTTNIGVGLDYEVSPQFQLNLEPIFKYQLNTFNSSTQGVNSYYFGIYSGFSFKF